MSASSVNPKKRKNFSIKEKIEIVDRVRNGQQRIAICREQGIPESTLRGWLKDEEKLRAAISEMDDPDQQRKRFRGAKDKDLDKAVITWFTQARSEGMPLSGTNIQDQAAKFHKMLHPNDETFNASRGWLRNFKDRHAIRQASIHGEQRSADEEAANSFPDQLRTILIDGGYGPEQVYNCDETALYFKLLPDKTLAQKSDTNKTLGYKQQKNRLTALLCTNSTGTHKLKPLIIGKFENPRCLHHVNRNALPTIYTHSKNAWMTASIFEDWFHQTFVPATRRHLRSRKLEPKAILLVDNCSAHPTHLKSKDGKITVTFLPKNTTSMIQPMDMGVIATTKRNYRRNLVQAIIDSDQSLTDYVKKMNIKDGMTIFATAWEEVSQQCIHACWMKGLGSAFPPRNESDSESEFEGFDAEDVRRAETRVRNYDGFNSDDMVNVRETLGDLTNEEVTAWLTADDTEQTNAHMTDEDIVNNVATPETSTNPDPDDDAEDDDYILEPMPSMSEVVRGFETCLRWLEKSSRTTSVELVHCHNMMRRAKKELRESCTQRKVTDYFNAGERL